MLRATEHEAASSCITITETPVLNTFVWVARVNAQGVPSPTNSSFLYCQRAAGVHGVGRRSCDPELCADRSASRMHPSSPAPCAPTCISVFTEGSEEICHIRPASWLLASWEGGERGRKRP